MTEQTSLGEKKQVATITLEVGKYVVHKHSSDTNEFSLLLLGYKFHEDHPCVCGSFERHGTGSSCSPNTNGSHAVSVVDTALEYFCRDF